MLFFTGARLTLFHHTLKELEVGHAVIMAQAFAQFDPKLPHQDLVILGNQRADLPLRRADGTISLWGLFHALVRAQLLPKYAHGMRQMWNHPTRPLWRVQQALYEGLVAALDEPDEQRAALRLGRALHTLQDTYTVGHTLRADTSDPHSPMLALHYSPSKAHPFISPNDSVWADERQTRLSIPAQTALRATLAALALWTDLRGRDSVTIRGAVCEFVNRYAPIQDQPFNPSERKNK